MIPKSSIAQIKVCDVSFTYENDTDGPIQKDGVHHIDFAVKPGECILLCGKSGCGKTTVTKLINGLIPNFDEGQKQGAVFLEEKNIEELAMYEISEKVASVFQNPKSQFFNLDPASEIIFTLENQGQSLDKVEQRLSSTIKELGLEALMGKSMFGMSGGEKQRIAFACAYASNPQVVVLDEPTANLDVEASAQIASVIEKLKALGKTIIIAEHRLGWLQSLADRVFLFQDGCLIDQFTATDFFNKSDGWRRQNGLRQIAEQQCTLSEGKHKTSARKIELQNVELSYGKDCIASNLNCTLYSGEVTAITGRNGAGKTTLSRTLCGLHKESAGKILVNGKPLSIKQRRTLSYLVMQDVNHQLFAESVEAECFLGNIAKTDEVEELLKSFDLYQFKDKHPQTLSGGQKQRLAVVTALLSQKEVLIFDEPTSGLDYENMIRVSTMLRKLAAQGRFVLVVTHDKELIESACDRCLRLENTQIVEDYRLT